MPDCGRTKPQSSEQTGGRHFAVDYPADLPDAAAKVGIELRDQYVLGYSPKNAAHDGKYRRVQVKVVKTMGLPPLKVMSRTGYYVLTRLTSLAFSSKLKLIGSLASS